MHFIFKSKLTGSFKTCFVQKNVNKKGRNAKVYYSSIIPSQYINFFSSFNYFQMFFSTIIQNKYQIFKLYFIKIKLLFKKFSKKLFQLQINKKL